MRKMFIEGSLAEAKMECPWAFVYVRVTRGYMCFESIDEALDYHDCKEEK